MHNKKSNYVAIAMRTMPQHEGCSFASLRRLLGNAFRDFPQTFYTSLASGYPSIFSKIFMGQSQKLFFLTDQLTQNRKFSDCTLHNSQELVI